MLPLLLVFLPAAEPPSPLRLIPDKADVLLHVPGPRALAEGAFKHKLWEKARAFAVVKEQLDATGLRRARQMLAFLERSLEQKWPDLLDEIAGGGIVIGAKFGNNQPAIVVVQGRDEKKQQRFLAKALEATGIEAKKSDYHGMPTWAIGDGLFLARAGTALVASNKRDALKAALDLARGKGGKSIAEHTDMPKIEKLLPAESLARLWINMRPVQASEEGKRIYADPREDTVQTVLFGSYLSVLGRTPFVCAGLVAEEKGVRVTFRAPRGTEGMGSDKLLHVLPEGETLRQPLEPEGTLYSLSFCFDFASVWKHRGKLFNAQQIKGLEQAEKQLLPFTGAKLGNLLESTGAAHRFVLAHQTKPGYTKRPTTAIPAFALVAGLRDGDKFASAMESMLKAASIFVAGQFKLVRKEEKVGGLTVVGYRFSEREAVESDPGSDRYNYSPCWVRVKDQFVFSSTMELASALVPLLQAEKPAKGLLHHRAIDRLFPDGFARLMKSQEDVLVTQAVLDQAVPPAEAREQVRAFTALVKSLGGAGTSSFIGKKEWRFDIWLNLE